VEFSQRLNDAYLKAKAENSSLKKDAKKAGLLNENGYGYSELSRDL
jgi:hypothetical protein